jgi:hypothetical protein
MHDAMINELGKAQEFVVLSRASVLGYRDTDLPAAQESYLRGLAALRTRTVDGIDPSIAPMLEQKFGDAADEEATVLANLGAPPGLIGGAAQRSAALYLPPPRALSGKRGRGVLVYPSVVTRSSTTSTALSSWGSPPSITAFGVISTS